VTVHYSDDRVTLHHGDCLDVLPTLPDNSVDAVVTDPPYNLSFMSKSWDAHGNKFQAWCRLWAAECLRILKPGGHLLAFGGTRTSHRLACAIEDAGFEIRDSIAWLYGSGFPKSLDVSKAIDKAAGAEREVTGDKLDRPGYHLVAGTRAGEALGSGINGHTVEQRIAAAQITAPATPEAARWQGWGTALKPAHEPVIVARKPLQGTVSANVQRWGTGALNIDATRIGMSETDRDKINHMGGFGAVGWTTENGTAYEGRVDGSLRSLGATAHAAGRWPANVVLDESQAEVLDQMSANLGDERGASRFMYTAKASTDERIRHNGISHATVKPLSLMRWLVKLVTPPGGVVLEPFAGSGTTVEACILEGFKCVAIEREAEYLPLITQRINRRLDPIAYLAASGDDLGLFGDS
jgi:DNA modification methylase